MPKISPHIVSILTCELSKPRSTRTARLASLAVFTTVPIRWKKNLKVSSKSNSKLEQNVFVEFFAKKITFLEVFPLLSNEDYKIPTGKYFVLEENEILKNVIIYNFLRELLNFYDLLDIKNKAFSVLWSIWTINMGFFAE